jgi:predicted RNA-binding protein with PIN domain
VARNSRRCTPDFRVLLLLVAGAAAEPARAWIYPEHRDIAMLAVQGLDAERGAQFAQLWSDARAGDAARLCERAADTEQSLTPECVDWAALSAIAGDHSCSSRELVQTVRESPWILMVADIAAQLKVDLAAIPVSDNRDVEGLRQRYASEEIKARRANALRTADTRIQRADRQYATRADSNLAHFMLARPDTQLDPFLYAQLALRTGSQLNAVGVYTWYHISALQKANRLRRAQLTTEERQRLTRAMLFDEAFALHFLEDMYAAGHVSGSWGDISQRKGTHDFYNVNGLEVFTWKGRDNTIVLAGDAHMRAEDSERVARAVRQSLMQVLEVAAGQGASVADPGIVADTDLPETFDVCTSETFPAQGPLTAGNGGNPYADELGRILLDTPVPGLGEGLGSMPRAHSEVGQFFGLTGAIDARRIDQGFSGSENQGSGWIGGLDVGFRAGLGLDGVLGNAGDGLVFVQFGLRSETPSSNRQTLDGQGPPAIAPGSTMPARSGLSTRIRMPFFLVPGDLLLMSPLFFFNRPAYENMAVTAANGGFIPWQYGIATGIGRFQLVAGRELGVTWYGTLFGDSHMVTPALDLNDDLQFVTHRSIFFDVPLVEYRPYRSFTSNQSSTVLFQLFAGIDVPHGENTTSTTAPAVNLDTIYSLGVRLLFDWRYYP